MPGVPQPDVPDGIVGKISELARLRDSGALSEEEFTKAKAEVLNRSSATRESLVEQPVTRIEAEQWASKGVVLRSDGSPKAFLDVIVKAVEVAGYPVTERNYTDMKVTFESRGMSWKSWSGDVTTVLVSPNSIGSEATFTSKGKPSGALRVQARANATTWVERLVPGFGNLWRGGSRLRTR